ncbi:hypothetical protein GCM10020001_023670 [Nonomuraea salmonea]
MSATPHHDHHDLEVVAHGRQSTESGEQAQFHGAQTCGRAQSRIPEAPLPQKAYSRRRDSECQGPYDDAVREGETDQVIVGPA